MHLIFVVDDEPIMLDTIACMLEDTGRIETFESGEACLARLAVEQPNLLLVDMKMPGMSGLELCTAVKANPTTADIPVIFVSADDQLETRLHCYDAGAADFILKPFEGVDLVNKVSVTLRGLEEKQRLNEQAGYARETAMSAMSSMGELGVVLNFLSHSFAAQNEGSIASHLLEALHQYDLQVVIGIEAEGVLTPFSASGSPTPLEMSVLEQVKSLGRIFQFKSRCVFNYQSVTVLIHNMPADEERAGRIRDNVALLAEGAHARVQAILAERQAQRHRASVEAALPYVHGTLAAVQENYRRNCFELTRIMIEYEEAQIKSFVHLGLTESQEVHLSHEAREYMQRMVDTQDESQKIVGQLEALVRHLEPLLKT